MSSVTVRDRREVREDRRCCAIGFEAGGRGDKPMSVGGPSRTAAQRPPFRVLTTRNIRK